jgi:hypothetical protein
MNFMTTTRRKWKGSQNQIIREAQKETAHYKTQFENAMSLVEDEKLSIKTSLAKRQNWMPKRQRKCVVCMRID